MSARAKQVHDRAIVIDTHDDTTERLIYDKTFDIAARNKDGNLDIPRMREGGLDALFFSIWVPGDVTGPTAVKRALDQIDAVREAVRKLEVEPMSASVAMVPFEFVKLTGREAQSMLKLMDVLEDHDDVQHAWSNFDIDEKEIEASLL